MKQTILLTDCGDTIIDEGTQIFDSAGIVVEAEPIGKAVTVYKKIADLGYRLGFVADGQVQSFENLLNQHQLKEIFESVVISETLGVEKPDAKMFQQAFDEMNLTESDKNRVLMVGNNLERDVLGANQFGIQSIFLDWSPRYKSQPANQNETPDFTINDPEELLLLLEEFEQNLAER